MEDINLIQKTVNLINRYLQRQLRKVYYQARESLGHHKRDIVVCQVEQACESLHDTKVHFEGALERFKSIVVMDESSLEHKYKLLQRQYDFCKIKADTVTQRIKAIEDVSAALFVEWESELNEYSNRSLKARSRQQLKLSQQHYARLIKAMQRAEARISPVLMAFKDQVLYLKHNLNAQAIAAIEHEFIEISLDMSQLIQAMEMTIAEASQFVASLSEQKALPGY